MTESEQGPKGPEIIVKGGTGTSKSEALYEERFQEAEQRRDMADAERKLSQDQQELQKPDGDGTILLPGKVGGAVQATTQFTEHPEIPKAYFDIHILNRNGAPTGERCLADVIQGMNPDDPSDLAFVIVCPYCEENSHKHEQDNQLHVLQSNRHWEAAWGAGPPTIYWPDAKTGLTLPYKSAGVLLESEPFTCPDCRTRYRVHNNTLRPE